MGASSGNISILTLTIVAAATVAANRFVTTGGVYPAAGGKARGVTRFGGVSGDALAIDVEGTTIVECGAAVAVDDDLMVDATGRVVPVAGSAKRGVASALEAGGAAGAMIEVLLTPSAGPATA